MDKKSPKLFYQDDAIELLESISSQENISVAESSTPSILKLKRNNKIHSPPPLSPQLSQTSSLNDVRELFKAQPVVRKLPPVAAPRRRSKETKFIESERNSIVSPRSETISYKEQLRNRFLSVKKQAGSSISQTPVNHKRNSIVDNISQENEEIENELRKRQPKISSDGFDFFCKNNGSDKTDSIQEGKEADEDDEIKTESKQEEEKDSLIEFLGLDIRDTEIVEKMSPIMLNISENEKELYWNPSSKFVDTKTDLEVRDIEDEGLFKSEEPKIPKSQLNKLKSRLINDEDRQWFESDGRLIMLSDPRLDTSFKPFSSVNLSEIKDKTFNIEYTPPKIYTQTATIDKLISSEMLEIEIHSLKFTHHPLFSPEHVLSTKLLRFYDQYLEIKMNNKFLVLQKTLDALIFTRKRLKNISMESGDGPDQSKVRKYKSEITEIRCKLYEEGFNYRELLKSILKTWKSIKTVRNEQKYTNTSVKLVIKKEYGDYDEEKQKWEENIEDEVEDILSDYEESFQELIQIYKEELKEWKTKKREKFEEDDHEELPDKPKKPQRDIDRDKIINDVMEKSLRSLKPPGEPILEFELVKDKELVTKDVVNPKELLRRSALNKTSVYFKIRYNKQEICKSKTVSLNNDFVCEFYEPFTIKITSSPVEFTLDLYELSGGNKKLVHQIDLIDKFRVSTDDVVFEPFERKDKQNYSHTGVGSGVNTKNVFKSYDLEVKEEELYTSGLLSWKRIIEEKTQMLTSNVQTLKTISPASKILNIDNIFELSKMYIDPLDPQNSLVYEYVKNIEKSPKKDYFQLEPEMKSYEFCTTEELDNNPRFKMLKLRDRNEPEFQGIVVPNRVKEIPEDAFVAYEKRCQENQSSENIDQFRKEDIEGQRKWGLKLLQRAENKVIQLSKLAENKMSLQDVLTEETIPTLGSLGLTFMNWLQPNRPLRPVRRGTKPSQTSLSLMKDAKIIMNIVGAIQVPIRKDGGVTAMDQLVMVPVRPFVVVTFKDKQARTTVAEGANPIWNQELTIPLENLSENSLHNLNGNLHLHLYDETVLDLMEDDRLRHTHIHQQLGYNWLGGIQFPITMLLYNKRIEGTFKLNSPSVLLGYENHTTQFYTDTVSHRQDTYLTVFLTMQPTIERIRRIQPQLDCNEMDYLEEHIRNWEMEYNILYPHRPFTSLVVNISGELSCITRYFKPLNAPQMDDLEVTEQHCARFVAMIPFKDGSMSLKIPSIWLTAEQTISVCIGSITDHAVLLMCFFMGIGIKCWLLIGYGIPHGLTTYVLTVEKNSLNRNSYFIYDVENAYKYNVRDNFSPLQKVYCLINDENVWGNIQVEERAHMSKFNVTRSSEWLPLFNKTVSAPVVTQQKMPIIYIDTPSVLYLQEKIEKRIKQKIMKWRKHRVTIWNHYVCSVLKQILPRLEWVTLMDDVRKTSRDFEELHSITNSYKMCGFAINFPYTSIKNINNYLRATNIHCNENPNTEFALGVYVHPYPNYALVVWIYLATVLRRR